VRSLPSAINQHLLIGGQVDVWTKTVNNATLSFGNVAAAVYYYPAADSGFFLMGGVGGSSIQLEAGSFNSQTNGSGLTAGIGYDWRVGKSFALTRRRLRTQNRLKKRTSRNRRERRGTGEGAELN
jgi:hypothetical protein